MSKIVEIPMEEFYNKHYIEVDDRGLIVRGFSDAFEFPTSDSICINDKAGRHFQLIFPDGTTSDANPAILIYPYKIPLYSYHNGEITKRSDADVQKDIDNAPKRVPTPTQLDMIQAQLAYTAIITDTLIPGGAT